MTKELIRVVSSEELREFRHASDALQILYECPGSYITAPLLISALTGSTVCSDSYVTCYNLMKVWFQTEESRKKGVRSLSDVPEDILYSVRHEVGAPESVLPKAIGFTVGCVWLEPYHNGAIAIYGTPDGKKDLGNSVFDLCPEADPLVGILSFYDFRRYSSPFTYSDNVLRNMKRVAEDEPFEPCRSSGAAFAFTGGTASGRRSEIAMILGEAGGQFHSISRLVPEEMHLPVFAGILKHNIRCSGYLMKSSETIELGLSTIVRTMRGHFATYSNVGDLASRVSECARRIPAFGQLRNVHTEFASRALSMDFLYTMILLCEENESRIGHLINFVEGIASLPDDDKPSMWDIYTSWKNGCEHWELGPVLAAPFIERIPGSRGYFEIQGNILAR